MARTSTKGWRDGDVVTLTSFDGTTIAGRVVVRGRAVRVAYVDLAGRSREGWPDNWAIGSGAFQGSCVDCGNDFRSDDRTEIFCGPCFRSASVQTSGAVAHRTRVEGRWR